jgi:hypothetical protein
MNVTRSDLAEKRKYSTFLAIVKSDIALENPEPVVRVSASRTTLKLSLMRLDETLERGSDN